MPLTVCFQLVESALNNFHQVTFLRHTHVLLPTNAAKFQILSYLCPVLRTGEGVFILVY